MSINASLIGQMLTFVIFVWFCMKFIWPRLISTIEERQKTIADGLSAADKGQRELEAAKHKVNVMLDEAKQKTAALLAATEQRAQHIIEEAKAQAVAEQARIIKQAEVDIEQQTNTAKRKLYTEVSQLAVLGAEKIIARQINASDEEQLLTELLSEVNQCSKP